MSSARLILTVVLLTSTENCLGEETDDFDFLNYNVCDWSPSWSPDWTPRVWETLKPDEWEASSPNARDMYSEDSGQNAMRVGKCLVEFAKPKEGIVSILLENGDDRWEATRNMVGNESRKSKNVGKDRFCLPRRKTNATKWMIDEKVVRGSGMLHIPHFEYSNNIIQAILLFFALFLSVCCVLPCLSFYGQLYGLLKKPTYFCIKYMGWCGAFIALAIVWVAPIAYVGSGRTPDAYYRSAKEGYYRLGMGLYSELISSSPNGNFVYRDLLKSPNGTKWDYSWLRWNWDVMLFHMEMRIERPAKWLHSGVYENGCKTEYSWLSHPNGSAIQPIWWPLPPGQSGTQAYHRCLPAHASRVLTDEAFDFIFGRCIPTQSQARGLQLFGFLFVASMCAAMPVLTQAIEDGGHNGKLPLLGKVPTVVYHLYIVIMTWVNTIDQALDGYLVAVGYFLDKKSGLIMLFIFYVSMVVQAAGAAYLAGDKKFFFFAMVGVTNDAVTTVSQNTGEGVEASLAYAAGLGALRLFTECIPFAMYSVFLVEKLSCNCGLKSDPTAVYISLVFSLGMGAKACIPMVKYIRQHVAHRKPKDGGAPGCRAEVKGRVHMDSDLYLTTCRE